MTTLPNYSPFYGGGQVKNPANVIGPTSGAPSAILTDDRIGSIAIDPNAQVAYILVSKTGGENTWAALGISGGALVTLSDASDNTVAPDDAGNIELEGTDNQINVVGIPELNLFNFALSDTLVAPGTLTVTSTSDLIGEVTMENGASVGDNFTVAGDIGCTGNGSFNSVIGVSVGATTQLASTGTLLLNGADSKIHINVGTSSSTSAGTTLAMSGNPGSVNVVSSSITAASLIFYSRRIGGGTLGNIKISNQSGAGTFTLTSDSANETSTFNYWIIN